MVNNIKEHYVAIKQFKVKCFWKCLNLAVTYLMSSQLFKSI